MNGIFAFLTSIFTFMQSMLSGGQPIAPELQTNTPPQPETTISSMTPTTTPAPLPSKKPTATPLPPAQKKSGFTDTEKKTIILYYTHTQCLADQKPNGAEQFNALVASDNDLIAKYGVDKEVVWQWSNELKKADREFFNKIVTVQNAPCPIVSP